MPRNTVQAVRGSCRLQRTCQDAATLHVLRDCLEDGGYFRRQRRQGFLGELFDVD